MESSVMLGSILFLYNRSPAVAVCAHGVTG